MLMMTSRFLLARLTVALLFTGTKFTYAQAEKESGVKEAMAKGKGRRGQI
jgi:hypothetical protein